ncbi:hypothetical protein ABFX02_03G009000 [Erythranthe guttata]
MAMRNIFQNTSPSRFFWGVLYTIFFTFSSFSFHSAQICTEKMHSILYVAVAFLVYWLLIPFVYLFYCAVKEIASPAQIESGGLLVDIALTFLRTAFFPLACVWMVSVFKDAVLCACMGALGSVFCLFACFMDPEEYGLTDYFYGLFLGVFVSTKGKIGKCLVSILIMASNPVARKLRELRERH